MLTSVTTPKQTVRADAAQRAAAAWNARVLGASWEQAAQIAGFSNAPNAHRAVTNAYGQVPEPERDELRRVWRDRLEHSWRQVVRDMAEQRPGATTASVRIAGAAAALDGLNEPTEIRVSPSTAEIEAFVARVRAAEQPQVVEFDILGELEPGSVD
jgi:hypothetical protein